MTQVHDPIVVVNDASCLIDLRKARLLHLLVQLPCRLVIPLPVRESELIRFTPQEWALLDAEIEIFDVPPAGVTAAIAIKAAYPKLSVNDCFCLVTTRCHENALLLTGDRLLRSVASGDGQRVHGVLWVVDELQRLALCNEEVLVTALELWRDDPTVRLPAVEINRRLRSLGG